MVLPIFFTMEGGVSGLGWGKGIPAVAGEFVCHRRLLSVHQIFQTCQLVLCGGPTEVLARKADGGAHLKQLVIDAGMGGALGGCKSWRDRLVVTIGCGSGCQ